jgi:hypothetical protein
VEVVIVILVIIVGICIAIVAARMEAKRREAFRAVAKRLGLSFKLKDSSIDNRYKFLSELRKGDNRHGTIVLHGTYKDQVVEAFEYHYETYSTDSKGNRTTHHHYSNHYVITESDDNASLPYPELRVYPENFLSKIGQAMGYDDIDFESIEFSKSFTVRCKEKRFAYDICHPRMMEWLLDRKKTILEIEGPYIAISFGNKMSLEAIESRLNQLIEIRELFPEYLLSDSN